MAADTMPVLVSYLCSVVPLVGSVPTWTMHWRGGRSVTVYSNDCDIHIGTLNKVMLICWFITEVVAVMQLKYKTETEDFTKIGIGR